MHSDHRRRFLASLRDRKAAAVIPTSPHRVRNHDCEYRFRPDSDFWYLTGFAEPESVLVLLSEGRTEKGEHTPQGEPMSILFLRPKDAQAEVWNGRRLGIDAAPEALGVDLALPYDELWKTLPELLRGYGSVVYRLGQDGERDKHMIEALGRVRFLARRGGPQPKELCDPAPILHEQRLFKSEAELAIMRRAAEVTAEAHLATMAAAAPGVNECELDGILEYTFRRRGGSGAAYTPIVAGGDNACILHYVENNAPLKDGDLCLIDAGCEMDLYASDVTRTFPVNGTFTDDQRALYQVVLDAQEAAIAVTRPGHTFEDIHQASIRTLTEGLLALGILSGDLGELLESNAHAPYSVHRTGHWLGLDVHDCGAYTQGDDPRPLEAGMVTTVEPGLYFASDDETVDPRWRGLGIRIEDDILVTDGDPENLTASIPKSIEAVEAACQARALATAH